MATFSVMYAFSLLFSLSSKFAISQTSDSWNLTTWCDTTPHPNICYSNVHRNDAKNVNREDFRRSTLVLAVQDATKAQKKISDNINNLKENDKSKKEWKSCNNLFKTAVHDLTNANGTDSRDDKRHFLSKALTNVGKCYTKSDKGKFHENDHLKAISSHVYSIIENAIAIHNDEGEDEKSSRRKGEGSRTTPANEVVVAQDGSGDFRTLKEAVEAAERTKRESGRRFVIRVKEGTYNEYVVIPHTLKDVTLIGDGIGKTIITGDKHATQEGIDTYNSATFAVEGDGFVAEGINFRNTAGRDAGQAVALRSHSDRSAFYKCSFESYEDTIFLFPGRHFFRDCDIYGARDFICGDSTAVFQNCNIFLRRPVIYDVSITGQDRGKQDQSGFVIHKSRVLLTDELKPLNDVRVFLGRPWGMFSRTVFMRTYLEYVFMRRWEEMGTFILHGNAVLCGEFENTGPGAEANGAVKWGGAREIVRAEALDFTVGRFLQGDTWLPSTGVPYDAGL